MKRLIIILTFLVFNSCQNSNNQTDPPKRDEKSISNNDEFSEYLGNFKKVNLPITIKGCQISTENLQKFEGTKYSKYTSEYSLAYGQIPTNGNFKATITLGAADCYLPILTTFKPNGQIINQETIAIGGCGSDCGFRCEEFMTMQKDYSFYTSDTVSTYECDSLGQETPGTYEYYVIYKKGRLLSDGKIEITNEIKKPLEGRNEP